MMKKLMILFKICFLAFYSAVLVNSAWFQAAHAVPLGGGDGDVDPEAPGGGEGGSSGGSSTGGSSSSGAKDGPSLISATTKNSIIKGNSAAAPVLDTFSDIPNLADSAEIKGAGVTFQQVVPDIVYSPGEQVGINMPEPQADSWHDIEIVSGIPTDNSSAIINGDVNLE